MNHLITDNKETNFRKHKISDDFKSSVNETRLVGKLVNNEGIMKRVACILNGPKKVFILSVINKVVPRIEDTINRIKFRATHLGSIVKKLMSLNVMKVFINIKLQTY